MLTTTWNYKRIIVWRFNKPIYTIQVNNRNPIQLFENVKQTLETYKRKNVIPILRKVS